VHDGLLGHHLAHDARRQQLVEPLLVLARLVVDLLVLAPRLLALDDGELDVVVRDEDGEEQD